MNDSDRKRISKRLQEMDAAAARLKAAQRLGIGTPATAPPYAQGRSSAAQGDKRFGSKAIARVQQMAARPAGPPTSAVEGAKRGAGLGARAVARGVTGLADIVSPLSRIPYYLATGDVVPSVTESADAAMTKMGLPTPSGTAEQSISGLTSALTGGVGFGGGSMLAANAARSAGPVVAGATRALADMPFRQVLGSLTGEGSRQIAEASGAGPIGQTAAALAGGMVPFAGMRGPAMPRRPTAIPEAPAPLRVAPPAATTPSLDALDPMGLSVDTRRPNLARFPRRDLPAPSIMDLTPESPAYAGELARIRALEAEVGTPALAARDAQFIRRHRVQEGPTPPAPQTAPLDMSQKARMAREKALGFHDDTLYHGTAADIFAFKPSLDGTQGEGIYLATQPYKASGYADRAAGSQGPRGQNIIPVRVRGNIKNIKDPVDWTSPELGPLRKWYDDRKMDAADWETVSLDKPPIDLLKKAGIDGFRDEQTVVIFDPKNIRSVNAAFDPAKADSSNILYSGFDPTLAGKLFGQKPARNQMGFNSQPESSLASPKAPSKAERGPMEAIIDHGSHIYRFPQSGITVETHREPGFFNHPDVSFEGPRLSMGSRPKKATHAGGMEDVIRALAKDASMFRPSAYTFWPLSNSRSRMFKSLIEKQRKQGGDYQYFETPYTEGAVYSPSVAKTLRGDISALGVPAGLAAGAMLTAPEADAQAAESGDADGIDPALIATAAAMGINAEALAVPAVRRAVRRAMQAGAQ
jgi:hypothetical protein